MTERLSKSLADDLLARIGRGEFKPGDHLPTEPALMERYGVGRHTAREAMQSLVTLGLVDVGPRHGAVLLEGRAANALGRSAMSAVLHERTLDELYEVRLILEPVAAEKAAKERTDQDLEAIARAVIQFRIAYELGSGVAEADIQFHQTVATASGNSVLAHLLTPMSDLLLEARTRTARVSRAVDNAVAEHAEIARAIEARESEQAREAMADHIRQGIVAIGEMRECSS